MASQEIEFFDLASQGSNACWSINPWSYSLLSSESLASSVLTCRRKTRLLLNLKNLSYKTTWLEYPDVAPKLKSLGLLPNQEGYPYTIPAIRLPDGTSVMDSRKIATKIEKLYPSPSLLLDSPVLPQVEALIPKAIMLPLRGVIMPKIPRNLLNDPSAAYFEKTRGESFGCPLPELEKKTPEDEAWKEAEPGIKEMGNLLKKQSGPFFLGQTVSYADLIVVGALQFLKCIEARLYDKIVNIEPALGKLYEASKGWLERDSH